MLSPNHASTAKEYPDSLRETRLELRKATGNYEVRWTARDETGRAQTRTYSCRTSDYAEADAARAAWWATIQQVSRADPNKFVRDILDEYQRCHLDPINANPSNYKFLAALKAEFGPLMLPALTGAAVATFIANERKRGLRDSSIRRMLTSLNAALTWAKTSGFIPADTPMPQFKRPKIGAPRTRYLAKPEYERCFALASADLGVRGGDKGRLSRAGRFICLALETAARSGAIGALTWDRVCFARGVIDYREAGRRQTSKRRVTVPISNKLRPVLERAYLERVNNYVLDFAQPPKTSVAKFMKTHGFDANRHDLRRTWATLRAQWGVSLFDIAGVLGDTMDVVNTHYAHHAPEHLRGAVNATGPVGEGTI